MASSKLQQSLENGIHFKLNQLVGNWHGIMKTYFDGITPVNEAEITGSIKPLFDGRFVQHEYKSSFEGKPFEGIAIHGYNLKDEQYESAWIDTFHMGTAIMLSSSTNDTSMEMTGSYSSGGPTTETWKWRTEIKIEDENTVTIIAYNIDARNQETKAIETFYTRIKRLA